MNAPRKVGRLLSNDDKAAAAIARFSGLRGRCRGSRCSAAGPADELDTHFYHDEKMVSSEPWYLIENAVA